MSALIDAPSVFANLYQRWFDDARGLAAENRQQAQNIVGSHLADVLTLWDQRTRAYLPGAPIVLRFETFDLVAFVMREPYIALYFGNLETETPVATLQWRSLRPCSYAIGRQVRDVAIALDDRGLLTEAEVVLDDGGRLLLGERDRWSLPRAM